MQLNKGSALPAPWTATDIGGSNGSAEFKPCDGIGGKFTINAKGFSLPNSDVQEFVSQTICGNAELIARVCGITGIGWAGIQMRETTATGSKKVTLKTQLQPLVRREVRSMTNGFTHNQQIPRPFSDEYLRIVRNGNYFIGYTSTNGINWQFAFYAFVPMTSCIEIGLFVESINVNALTEAQFDNVFINGVPVNPLAVLDTPVEWSQDLEQAKTTKVYPNPSTGDAFVDLEAFVGKAATLRVFNNNGQLLEMIQIDEIQVPTQRLDLSPYQNGIYLINIQVEGYPEETKKLMLNR